MCENGGQPDHGNHHLRGPYVCKMGWRIISLRGLSVEDCNQGIARDQNGQREDRLVRPMQQQRDARW